MCQVGYKTISNQLILSLAVDVQMHLIELLLQAEEKVKCTTPVNCYRKYLGQLFLEFLIILCI